MGGLFADLVLALHFLYVCFTVGGEAAILAGAAMGWDWIRDRTFRLVHLAAVVLVAVEALAGVWCPLTVWEHALRGGDSAAPEVGFVARILRRIIFYDFPAWFFVVLYAAFAALVTATWVLVRPRRR